MTFKYVMSGAENALAGALAALSSAPRGERILFVLPAGAQLDMAALRVIRREAATRGVGVALVTEHPGTRMAAAREGVSTFRDAARAESARWRRLTFPRSPRRSSPSGAEVIAPLPPGLFQKASPSGFRPLSFVRSFARRRSPWWGSLLLVVALCLLMGGLLFALSIVVPDAAITMTPGAEPIEATVRLRAVSGAVADLDEGVVPAQTVSTQVSGEARTQTTGRRSEPATKAGGRVVFINMTSRQITIPQGTIVSTATGNNVQYLTVGPVDLAPGARASAAVQALLPGPNGNARAGTVTRVEGPLSLSIAVSNEAGFAGGTTAPQPVVTEEDKTRLQAQLLEELKNQALEKLLERDAKGSFISPDSISVLPLSPAFTPFVGEVSDELFLSMSVQAVGLAVDQAEANAAALAVLADLDKLSLIDRRAAAQYAREEGVPCLGLCLGLQAMTVEYARNVLGMERANSSEMDPSTRYPVIDLMHDQRDVSDKGGTMRLGAYYAVLTPDTKVADAYGEPVVSERHRHRYEFNSKFRSRFEEAGFVCSGTSPDQRLVEFIELTDHPFWVATQAHPEFKSRPDRPHPLFRELVAAALARHDETPPALRRLKVEAAAETARDASDSL
mgnify:CR=1 FL=1